jgi:hypothetical protein
MRIAATSKTPSIVFDYDQQTLEIKGVSCPENPKEFYEPLLLRLKEYCADNAALEVTISLDYFNTGSSKTLWMLFDILAKNPNIKNHAVVLWYTDDDDDELKEAGVIFEEMSGLKFEYRNL